MPAQASIIPIDADGGGSGGTGTGQNAAASPGPAVSWEGSVGDVKTGIGSKYTTVPLVQWTARGGLPVEFTLNHSSQSIYNTLADGPKWGMSGYSSLAVWSSNGNVTAYWDDQTTYTFTKNGSSYIHPPGIHCSLVANGNPITSYDLTDKNGVKYHFIQNAAYASYYYFLNTVTDTNNNVVTYTRNATTGRLTSIADQTGRSITLGYNGSGRLSTVTTAPLSRTWTLGYDGSSRLSIVTFPVVHDANGTAHTYTVQVGYDASNNINSYTDRRGKAWTAFYNTATDNSVAWEKDPYLNKTSFDYGIDRNGNANAAAVTITDPNGNKSQQTYDTTKGRLASETDELGNTESYYYDSDNNLTQKTDRRGKVWTWPSYDSNGNALTAKDPLLNATTYTYNPNSCLLTLTLPTLRSVKNTYDANDNLTKTEEKNQSGVTVATTTYTVSSGTYGLTTDKYDPNNHRTHYDYDANGYLKQTATTLGNTRVWTYDALGGVTSYTDFYGQSIVTEDEWERPVKKVFPDSSQYTWTYDGESHNTASTDKIGTWARVFDNAGRLLSEACGGTLGVSHTYDATGKNGLLSTTTDGAGRVLTFAYTDRDELQSVSDSAGTTSYQYDENGNVSNTLLPNGMSFGGYYDDAGHLYAYYNYLPNGGANTVYSSYAYTFDDDGRVTDVYEGTSAALPPTNNPTHTVFVYDGQGRLTSETRTGTNATTRTYGYDPAGNRTSQSINGTSTTLTVDVDDELKSTTGGYSYSYGYNANGEQTSCTLGGVVTTFGYDYEGNLKSVSSPGSAVTFDYDAQGRQVRRTVNGATQGYYLDGAVTLCEQNQSTLAFTDSYVWGVGQSRHNGEYVLHDALGSQCQLTNSSDTITATDSMTAFGVGTNWTGTATNKYWYKGLPTYRADGDGPQGGYFYTKVGARYYDAQFGRFITRDSVLTEKPYAYCNDDPVNFVDPDGHSSAKQKWNKFWKNVGQGFKNFFSSFGGISVTHTETHTGGTVITTTGGSTNGTYNNKGSYTNGHGATQQQGISVTKSQTGPSTVTRTEPSSSSSTTITFGGK